VSQSAAGGVTNPSAAQVLPSVTQSATGELAYTGSAAQTLPAVYIAVPRASSGGRFLVTPNELMNA
jgi:hypothetical protein